MIGIEKRVAKLEGQGGNLALAEEVRAAVARVRVSGLTEDDGALFMRPGAVAALTDEDLSYLCALISHRLTGLPMEANHAQP